MRTLARPVMKFLYRIHRPPLIWLSIDNVDGTLVLLDPVKEDLIDQLRAPFNGL